jgi:hypothetical protein
MQHLELREEFIWQLQKDLFGIYSNFRDLQFIWGFT